LYRITIGGTNKLDSERDKKLAGLLILAQQGDQVAYENFLIETAGILRRYLSKRMDIDLVEDVLQDTLLSIHRFLHTYLPGRPVGPWLYAICGNRMVDHYRRKRRIQLVEADVDLDDRSVAQIGEADQSMNGSALDALKKLPVRQRRVIELLKVQGLTVKEVAGKTGMSEASVKITAFRGYQAIRKLFGIKT
jgi:RNA polymerase sigma-70 factor (ECF subfamily)